MTAGAARGVATGGRQGDRAIRAAAVRGDAERRLRRLPDLLARSTRRVPSPPPASSTCLPPSRVGAGTRGALTSPRAFSVADAERERRRRAARLPRRRTSGPGTERLAALEPGEGLWMTGPLGPALRRAARSWRRGAGAILVGGGIGVAPLAIWRRRAARPRGPGAGPARLPRPRRTPAASISSTAARSGWPARTGTPATAATSPTCSPCCSRAMTRAAPPSTPAARRRCWRRCARCARDRGVACELAMEAPMACGFGACFGCAVPLSGAAATCASAWTGRWSAATDRDGARPGRGMAVGPSTARRGVLRHRAARIR